MKPRNYNDPPQTSPGEHGRDGSPSRPDLPTEPHSRLKQTGAFGESALPRRRPLDHQIPAWVGEGATFFITINCRPRGENHLAIPAVAEALRASLAVRISQGHWWPRLFLLMPDHLHGLLTLAPELELQKTIRAWKRYTARFAGIPCQRDFFDHRLRHHESLSEKWEYIAQNPVRAGLVTTPEEWPYVWTGEELSNGTPKEASNSATTW